MLYPSIQSEERATHARFLCAYEHTHTPWYSDPSFPMVPGMTEEKMDGGKGIFLMEKEEAE